MLPHGVTAPKQRRYHPTSHFLHSPLDTSSDLFGSSKLCFLAILIAIPSFLLGTTVSLYAAVDCSNQTSAETKRHSSKNVDNEVVEKRVQELLKEREEVLLEKHTELVRKLVQKRVDEECSKSSLQDPSSTGVMLDRHAVGNMVAGMAITPKSNFTDLIDLGVPLDRFKTGSTHALMLYSGKRAMPRSLKQQSYEQSSVPEVVASNAIENCDYLNVLLVDHSGNRKQCLALVPQYESFHVQKWMRVEERSNGLHGDLDSSKNLILVSRGIKGKGKDEFTPPTQRTTARVFKMLQTYLNSLDSVVEDLKNVIKHDMEPYEDSTIIVMVCNFGQSELLMNFACHARSKNFDTSAILVFATDLETADLARSLGLAAYYDKRVRIYTLYSQSFRREARLALICSHFLSHNLRILTTFPLRRQGGMVISGSRP